MTPSDKQELHLWKLTAGSPKDHPIEKDKYLQTTNFLGIMLAFGGWFFVVCIHSWSFYIPLHVLTLFGEKNVWSSKRPCFKPQQLNLTPLLTSGRCEHPSSIDRFLSEMSKDFQSACVEFWDLRWSSFDVCQHDRTDSPPSTGLSSSWRRSTLRRNKTMVGLSTLKVDI